MDKMVMRMAIAFALRQLAQFGTATDWSKIKADCYARINPLLHSAFLDQAVDALVSHAVDAVSAACLDTNDLQAVADKAVAGDWKGALDLIKNTLLAISHKSFGQQAVLNALS